MLANARTSRFDTESCRREALARANITMMIIEEIARRSRRRTFLEALPLHTRHATVVSSGIRLTTKMTGPHRHANPTERMRAHLAVTLQTFEHVFERY